MSPRHVVARMDHRCSGCGKPIGKGESCTQTGRWSGGCRFWHLDCYSRIYGDPNTIIDPRVTSAVRECMRNRKEKKTTHEDREGYNCEVCGKWIRPEDALFCYSCEAPLCENCGPLFVCPQCTR